MFDKKLFIKNDDLTFNNQHDFLVNIPRQLQSRQELFDALKNGLKLPDYFGYNWDALSECLRDLSWIKQRRVILKHHDIPNLSKSEIEEYFDILATSAEFWKNSNEHELIIAHD